MINIKLFLLIVANVAILFFAISSLSISGYEAKILFEENSIISKLAKVSLWLFGQNDYALRAPFIFIHTLNLILLYEYSKRFLKKESDAFLVLFVYMLMPGVISSALVLNGAGITILATLLLLLFIEIKKGFAYFLLSIYLFLDNSFSILFLALFFYSVYKKDQVLMPFSLLLFGINMYIFGFDDGGKPKGYFLDTIGVFAAIFSPLLFIYFVYSLYRVLIKEKKSLLWFISFVSFALALLLSFRQKIVIEDFAPFLVLGIIITVKTFLEAYRVRLPEYRKNYKIGFGIVIGVLFFLSLTILFNKPFYSLYQDPKKHPIYHYHVAKDLAKALKENGIYGVLTDNNQLSLRLKFYGIDNKGDYYLMQKESPGYIKKIDINYYSNNVASFYLYLK